MVENDTVQRFIFEHGSIRGEIAHLYETYKAIMKQHPYPEEVRSLLGEALISSVLIASSLKFEGEISIQFHGDKRLPLLLVQCDNDLHVRAFAKFEKKKGRKKIDYNKAFLEGKMVLTISQYASTQSYQSVVPIYSTSMAENLTNYFQQSEQIETRVWLATNKDRAAGMFLQLMPGLNTSEREEIWEYAVQLGQTITPDELLNLDNRTILHRLYHEAELRLFEERVVSFRCRCNPEKMKQVLTVLGEEDANALIAEKGEIEVNCDFCNRHYTFDAIDVALLFRK
ncbi:heat shock protein 33, redox regulated chaperonin (plasmid) [Legionella adelaidensis]|uniref:Heat shock protein 33, redox regulated chaperonin n=1 Tax=Legionella adelaidensis TaxID=45056 RepID=A0A0W0R3S4_9GAMM|nr:Hsp33 family molecular chaperone HslO [Legionella adelaidensis]KTC65701.1 heat shock protein 33, redox regulated chaperonin [Legionella adelaidensis]VEH85983.1 heat shock protein 33, redox regulated chaperonin [Legionella adelaidensis]